MARLFLDPVHEQSRLGNGVVHATRSSMTRRRVANMDNDI